MKTERTLPVPFLQLGLTLGLYFVLLWGGPFSDALEIAPTLRGAYTMFLHGGFVAAFATLFVRKGLRLHGDSVFLALCGVAGLVGFSLPALTVGYAQWQELSIAASAFLSGCAVAMLLFVGICSLATLSPEQRFGRFLRAAGLGLVVFLAVFRVLPDDYRSLANCIILFPLAFLITFSLVGAMPKSPIAPTVVRLPSLVQLCLSVFLLGLVSTVLIRVGEVVQLYQIAIAVLSGAVFALLWRLRKRSLGVTEIYLVLFPVVATLLLALPFGNNLFRNIAIFASNAAVEILLLTVFVQPRPAGSVYEPRLIVALLAAFHLSAIVGIAGGVVFQQLFGGDSSLMAGALYLCLYALSAFAFILLSRRGKRDAAAEALLPVKGSGPADRAEEDSGDAASAEDVASVGGVACGASSADTLSARATEAYGLSSREEEVLDLLLKGRDVRAIAEMLVISPNTVRFHVKNLYKLTGVHSKQELIDAVEQLDEPSRTR